MCFFGSSQPAAPPRPEFDDAPPVVTGSQTGVDNPIDTAKATETLRIKRQETEGFQNPGDSLKITGVTGSSGRGGVVARNKRSARLRGKSKSSNRTGGRA